MIAGTIVMEDTIIHFAYDNMGHCSLTVCDALTGRQASKLVDDTKFGMALGIAMDHEGSSAGLTEQQYEELVIAVTPVLYIEEQPVALRWLP